MCKFKDLEQSDYRLLAMPSWDSYDMKDLDGKYTGNVVDKIERKKTIAKSKGSWFQSSISKIDT